MSRRKKTITIGTDEYELTQIGATESYELYNEVIAAVGPALQARLGEIAGLAKSDSLDEVQAAALVLEAKRSISRDLMRELRSAFARNSKARIGSVFLELGEQGVFDQHFSGRMSAIDAWMVACMKHSFMSFLGESTS